MPSRELPRRTSRRPRALSLTSRGWSFVSVGAGSLLFAYLLQRSELLYLGSFLGLLPLLSLITVWLRRTRSTTTRTFTPPTAQAGHPLTVMIDVHSLSARATSLAPAGSVWRDTLPWAPFDVPAVSVNETKAETQLSYQLEPPTRGVVEIGPLRLEFSDPFGLARGATQFGARSRLVITPRITVFGDDTLNIASEDGTNRALQRRAQSGEDDLMTRQYRRGDALRRVHWRASAHHGELMVRQEEQRSHAEARIVLDTLQHNYRDGEPRGAQIQSEAFEWAVTFAASLGLFLERAGYIVHLVETGETQLSDPDQVQEFLENLASVRLVVRRADTSSILRNVERPDRAQGSVFVILAEPDALTLEALTTQRHAFGLAAVYLVGTHKADTVTRLRHAGWICVAVTPETPVLDAWLALGQAREGDDGRT